MRRISGRITPWKTGWPSRQWQKPGARPDRLLLVYEPDVEQRRRTGKDSVLAAPHVQPKFSAEFPGVRGIALVLIALAFLREASEIRSTPPQRIEATISASERLQWVCDNTTPDDLIIGDRIYDLPLFCGRRQGLCFFPDTDPKHHLRAGILQRFLRDRVGKFDQCYLVIGRVTYDDANFEKQWRALCGGFLTDLIYGRAETWPGIREVVRLDDAYVFEVDVLEFVAPGQQPRYARGAAPETMLETCPAGFQVSEKGQDGTTNEHEFARIR